MNVRRSGHHGIMLSPISEATPLGERSILKAEDFRRMITIERKRSERSRKPFMLLLLDMGDDLPSEKNGKILGKIVSALSASTRDTDVTGWYSDNCVVGVMFTEISSAEGASTPSTIITRVTQTLQKNLSLEQFNKVTLSFHVFPEGWDEEVEQGPTNRTLYPDLSQREDGRKLSRADETADGHLRQLVGAGLLLAALPGHRCCRQADLKRPGVLPPTTGRPARQHVCVSEISFDVHEQ